MMDGQNINGWKRIKLKEAAIKIVVGYVGPITQEIVTDDGVKFLSTTHIGENEFIPHNIRLVNKTFNEKNKKSQVIPGDIIIARHGDSGKACIIPEYINVAQVSNAVILRPDPEVVTSKFICYRLNAERQRMQKSKVGGVLQVVNTKSMESFQLDIPSIKEQQQIVSKIEELFSELDKGIEELKTAQQQLKVYRQAVLNSSIKSAELKTIESVVEKLDQGWSPKCYNEPSTDINEWAVIKTTAIQAAYFLENENKRLPEHLEPRKQHELKAGDILITRAGPRVRVGVCCMVKHTRPKLINCDKVYRIRINTQVALPEFIEVLLNSPDRANENRD